MDFQTSRAQFVLGTAAASVLTAWENSQRQHPAHPPIHRPQLPYNPFPISPISPSSSPASSAGSMSMASANHWVPSSMSEFETLQLRRGVHPATAMLADREPSLPVPANQQPFFEFDFSLPHIPHLSLQPQQYPQQQRCSPPLPTPTTPPSSSALFASPPTTSPSNMNYRRDSPSASSSSGMKRSSEEGSATSSKKPRACMSLKDFVPPDVTGLSKREARLVKNRAAAFLSRQRKREEFEMMEIRVAELERENSRLREVTEGASPAPTSYADSSELELLRIQLAASRQREAELVHRLECLKHEQQKIKTEASEPNLSDAASSGSNSPLMVPSDGSGSASALKNIIANPKGSASLGLMVLLCALPSLLSQPSSHPRSTLPTAQSFLDTIQWDAPSFFQTSTSASASIDEIPSWELDFPGANMDMDVDYGDMHNTGEEEEPEWKKLELGLEGGEDFGLPGLRLGALDISFATHRTKDGKIRVRVHSSPSSSSTSSATASVPKLKSEDTSPSLGHLCDPGLVPFSLPSPAQSHSPSASSSGLGLDGGEDACGRMHPNPLSLSLVDSNPLGPFLGAAGSSPTSGAFDLSTPFDFSNANGCAESGFGFTGSQTAERRRVRIALRSLPQPGGEGGEWEVEVR